MKTLLNYRRFLINFYGYFPDFFIVYSIYGINQFKIRKL